MDRNFPTYEESREQERSSWSFAILASPVAIPAARATVAWLRAHISK